MWAINRHTIPLVNEGMSEQELEHTYHVDYLHEGEAEAELERVAFVNDGPL